MEENESDLEDDIAAVSEFMEKQKEGKTENVEGVLIFSALFCVIRFLFQGRQGRLYFSL